MLAKSHDFRAHAKIKTRRAHETQFAKTDVGTIRLDDETRDTRDRSDALNRRQVANLRTKGIYERCDGGHGWNQAAAGGVKSESE